MALFDRFKAGLARTARQIRERFADAAATDTVASAGGGRPTGAGRAALDLDTFEAVEDALIAADVGLPATERIVAAVRHDRQGTLGARVGREVRRILGEAAPVPAITTVRPESASVRRWYSPAGMIQVSAAAIPTAPRSRTKGCGS